MYVMCCANNHKAVTDLKIWDKVAPHEAVVIFQILVNYSQNNTICYIKISMHCKIIV